MKAGGSLFLNSVTQAGVRVLGSACSLLLMWLIARRGAEFLGVFRTLYVFLLIGDVAALLGMQTYLMREVSIRPDERRRLGGHAAMFALAAGAVGGALIAAVALLWHGYSPAIRHGLLFVAVTVPSTAMSLVGVSFLLATGRATACSLLQGGETLLRTGGGIALILLGRGALAVIALMAVLRCVVPLGYWRSTRPILQGPAWRFEGAFFRQFLSHVPVFMGIALLASALRFAAPLLLPALIDDRAAGQFAAAYLFVDLLLLVPTALTLNLLPVLARRARGGDGSLRESCQTGVKVMALGVVPVAAILAAIAHPMFATVLPGKPAYAASASVLQIVIWTCCLQSIDQVLAATIVAKGHQQIDLQTLAVGSAAVVLLLVALVPRFGIAGAAWGVLGGYVLMLVTRFVLVGRHVRGLRPWELLWRPALAGLLAAAVAHIFGQWQWLVGALAGGLAYLGVLAAVGSFRQAERSGLMDLLQAGKSAPETA